MNIKNHTSTVSPESSISKIERCLITAGATGIMKEYTSGIPTSLVFRLPIEPGKPPITIKLPANVEQCHKTLWNEHVRTRSFRSKKTDADFKDQAARTAWRLMQDWVEVQVSLIKLSQLDAIQAFLPYCWDGRETVYEKVKAGNFAALMPSMEGGGE